MFYKGFDRDNLTALLLCMNIQEFMTMLLNAFINPLGTIGRIEVNNGSQYLLPLNAKLQISASVPSSMLTISISNETVKNIKLFYIEFE